ncbi:MAG: hypothetical protein NTU44_11475 [Bacteroidetes bacterium]|nr:hypothetical protein [Bacteroidota bacterium]
MPIYLQRTFHLVLNFGLVLSCSMFSNAQTVPENISYTSIYDFLDELANDKVIILNSAIKPYSRQMIALKLAEAAKYPERLNSRQLKEVNFYFREYRIERSHNRNLPGDIDLYRQDDVFSLSLNPLGVNYCDSLFRLQARPIAGYRYYKNGNGHIVHRWEGAEVSGYVGKHWGFYANLRDNYQSSQLVRDSFFTLDQGALYKGDNGPTDFAEMRAGLSYTWDWGNISLEKENIEWGNNYHGANILSGRPPSFALIRLNVHPVRWLDFNYFHGWLVSQVIDSVRTYQHAHGTRKIYRDKYIAANMLTVTPWKYFQVSLGNSVIYSDIGVQPLYLIPFLFFKAVDYSKFANSNDAGQNAQMFFDISSRNIRHLHLYTSFFIDEISFSRFYDKDRNSNYISGKAGARVSNFPLSNIAFTAEYTRTNPMVYQHYIETTSFASNRYTLGHYLRDNSEEMFFSFSFRPLRGLLFQVSYTHARHGNNYVYGIDDAWGRPFMETVTWEEKLTEVCVQYEIIEKGMVFFRSQFSEITGQERRFTPELYWGKTTTIETGINLGW